MLSLIPALLLLAFHGPAAVERYAHEGRLPEALRALERAWTPAEAQAVSEALSKQRKALASLVALTADPAFSKALSELFEFELAPDRTDQTDPTDRTDYVFSSEPDPLDDGFSECRRSRDGPLA